MAEAEVVQTDAMTCELYLAGNNSLKPLRTQVTQVVLRLSDGTPVMVVAMFGDSRQFVVSHVGDSDFNTIIENMGLGFVQTDTVSTANLR